MFSDRPGLHHQQIKITMQPHFLACSLPEQDDAFQLGSLPPQYTTKNFQSSNSRFRGKNPCLARHAALRCGIFSLQEVPFFEQISGLAIQDC
jgi:hypothetical protein